MKAAVIFPSTRRTLIFAVPWRSSVIVGTTDDEYDGQLDSPRVTLADREYLLGSLSRCFDREFTEDDVVGAYAGLRPLIHDAQFHKTRDLSRRHAISRGPKGVITVTGGKLTTYRLMAEQVVDLVTRSRGRYIRSITGAVRLGVMDLPVTIEKTEQSAKRLDLPPSVVDSLVLSYGDEAPKVLELAREMELATPVADHLPYLKAEVIWGLRNEMAATVEDALARRIRVSLEDPSMGLRDRSWITQVFMEETGHPQEWIQRSLEQYEVDVLTERSDGTTAPSPRS